ncbi:MAG: PEP-CTERM sorting domain-containing protein [Phycisphaerae bacterium]|nr:PEP-CTERM sorting domain-containing protein [Planctomycetota bacterium]MBL7220436.1 PEP-CTERM sorting domain-containing protein [Phycisphaerae bacterium]
MPTATGASRVWEPATLSLLALGGLAVLRRRRA